jgi:hypothetical protein
MQMISGKNDIARKFAIRDSRRVSAIQHRASRKWKQPDMNKTMIISGITPGVRFVGLIPMYRRKDKTNDKWSSGCESAPILQQVVKSGSRPILFGTQFAL